MTYLLRMRKSGIAVLVIVVAVLILGAFGYIAFSSYQKNVADKINYDDYFTPTTDSSSTWKTYISNKWGFSFEYPGMIDSNINVTLTEKDNYVGLSAPTEWGMTIKYLKNVNINDYARDFLANSNSAKDLGVKKFNGYTSRQILLQSDMGDAIEILIQQGSDLIDIYAPSSHKHVQQILDSFKVLPSYVGKMCGGIAGISCPSGYICELDGYYPDASGKCIKNQ